MAVNGMNVGTDFSFAYYDGQSGTLVNMGDLQNVKITAQKHQLVTRPYNNDPRYGYVPDGYKIDFQMTRSKADLENLQITYSLQFDAGNIIAPGVLNESVNNTDGTVSRYQYTNFVFWLDDNSDVSREKVVTMRGEGLASAKVRIA